MFETDRLILRKWKESDLVPFHHINSDPLVLEFLPKALNKQESDSLASKIKEGLDKNSFGWWAVELKDTNEFIGFTGLSIPSFNASFTPCIEIGWRLASQQWGKGYATEAALKSLELGFGHFELEEILSFTVPDNIRSRRVMEKIGMSHDPTGDFEHPRLPSGDRLSKHVLYRLTKESYYA